MRRQKQAYLYAFLVVLLWATVASAFKLTLRHVSYVTMLFYSSATSLAVLTLLMVVQHKLKLLRDYSKGDLIQSLLLGALNPFAYYLILFKAYSLLPAQQAQTLNQTWAVVIPFLSSFILGQQIDVKNIAGLVVSFLGVVILATYGDPYELGFSNPFGIFLALGSSLIWALFWVYNVKDKRDPVAKLFLNFLFGFIFVAIAHLLLSEVAAPTLMGVIGTIYIGLFEMGITFVFWLKALQISETTAKITNLVYLVPFISLLVINLIVGEEILWSTILGLLFIVGGIVIQQHNGS